MKLKNLKDRLKDETLDLSLCDLEEVPVKEIAAVRKATHLDLSSNLLVSLPSTFVMLKQIVKLDLSRNMLTEIPENFGELKQLRYLDLYGNQISRLPLSLAELKNLRWLDLKENPLTPAVATVAGHCSNLSECRACATNVVDYLSKLKVFIEEEKQKRLSAIEASAEAAAKKSEKKKKKKSEKESKKNLEKNGSHATSKAVRHNENETKVPSPASNDKLASKGNATKGKPRKGLGRTLISAVLWSLFLCTVLTLALAILPSYYERESELVFDYVETRTGMPVKELQRSTSDALHLCTRTISIWSKNALDTINDTYEKYLKTSVDVPSSGH